jgi:hypothetical protein
MISKLTLGECVVYVSVLKNMFVPLFLSVSKGLSRAIGIMQQGKLIDISSAPLLYLRTVIFEMHYSNGGTVKMICMQRGENTR